MHEHEEKDPCYKSQQAEIKQAEVDKACVYAYTYSCYFRIFVLVIHDTWICEKSASSG